VFASFVIGLVLVQMAGCSSGTTRPKAAVSGDTVHFTDFSDNDGSEGAVIFTGAIGDYGKAVSIYPNGTIDPEHDSELNFALAKGSFRISLVDLHKKIVGALKTSQPNPRSCSGYLSVSGTSPILAGSGTGAYARMSGVLDVTMTLDEIVPKSKCDWSGTVLKQAIVISGLGTVTFG